ncbi:MAG: hypothetical protein MHMPM18_005150, partial [Marteilia pararefringens]
MAKGDRCRDGCKFCKIIGRALQLFFILSLIIASLVLTTEEYFDKSSNFPTLSKCAKKSFYDPESRKCIR